MCEQNSEKAVGSFLVREAVLDTSRKFSAAIHYSFFKAKGQRLIIIMPVFDNHGE